MERRWKSGDRVLLGPIGIEKWVMNGYGNNPVGVPGTVAQADSSHVSVDWDNGQHNGYRPKDLIPDQTLVQLEFDFDSKTRSRRKK